MTSSKQKSEINVNVNKWKRLERSILVEFDVSIGSQSTAPLRKAFALYGSEWYIEFQPFGGDDDKYASVFLHVAKTLSSQNKQTVSYEMEYKVANNPFSKLVSSKSRQFEANGTGWGSRNAIERSLLESTSDKSQRVVISVFITVHVDPSEEKLFAPYFEDMTLTEKHVRDPSLSYGYNVWSIGADFSDFHIKYKESSFPVSKAIIAGRSPVFRTMLASTMLEAAQGELEMQDPSQDDEAMAWLGAMSVEALESFLLFLYTDCIAAADLEKHAGCLLLQGHKYEVSGLITLCICRVCNTLNISSFYQLAQTADVLCMVQLMKIVIDFGTDRQVELVKHYEDRYFTLPSTITNCIMYAVAKMDYEKYLLHDAEKQEESEAGESNTTSFVDAQVQTEQQMSEASLVVGNTEGSCNKRQREET